MNVLRRFVLPITAGVTLGVLLVTMVTAPLTAQEIWPDRAENLQVLPVEFPPDRLRAVMRGFSNALGVRCSHCHDGEDGEPLSTYDFASDANPNKKTARRMLEMLSDINEHLSHIEPSGPERVNMWCNTCHAGKPRPMTLAETLVEVSLEGGADTVLARYESLREAFYGGNQYDFSAPGVAAAATALAAAGEASSALALLKRNVEHYPAWWQSHERIGDIYRARGEEGVAVQWYQKALELAPAQSRLLDKLGRR